jgi:hypothetical protein
MKAISNWRVITALIAVLTAAGVGYVNIEDDLAEHPVKEYKFRSLDRPLYITFHHSATKGQSLREIAEYHVEERGYPGIAYHFAINWEGQVFQLQDLEEITYHSKGRNTESIGVVFVGNYQERDLPDEAVVSAELLVQGLRKSLDIVGVRAHRDVRATLCPGDSAYSKIRHLFW